MTLDVHYMAIVLERERLPTQAHRGWLATKAGSAARREAPIGRLRHAAGAALVHVGERLQGTPGLPQAGEIPPAFGAIEP